MRRKTSLLERQFPAKMLLSEWAGGGERVRAIERRFFSRRAGNGKFIQDFGTQSFSRFVSAEPSAEVSCSHLPLLSLVSVLEFSGAYSKD